MSFPRAHRFVSGAALGAVLLAWAAPSFAETPSAAASATDAQAAPDLVLLKNGGMIRGTISELDPSGSVVITTAAGKVREISMSEVEYAGPADKRPQAAPVAPAAPAAAAPAAASTEKVQPRVVVHSQEARVQFEASEPGVTMHVRTGSAVATTTRGVGVSATAYDEICAAPCEASLPAGTHTLAASIKDRPPAEADPVTLPPGRSTVTATYEDKSGVRIGGLLVFLGGTIGGGSLAVLGILQEKCETSEYGTELCSPDTNVPMVTIGGVLFMGGLFGGLAMMNVSDTVQVEVVPGMSTGKSTRGATAAVAQDRVMTPEGITVRGTF